METPQPIQEYIKSLEKWQQEIVNQVSKAIHSADEHIEEEIKWGSIAFSHIKNFAGFRTTKNHVLLVFFEGQRLNDPKDRLDVSTDSKVASLKWKQGDAVDQKYVAYLTTQAIRL